MRPSRSTAPALLALVLTMVTGCGTATSSGDEAADDPTTTSASPAPTATPTATASESTTPSPSDPTTEDTPTDPQNTSEPAELTTAGLATGAPPAVDYLVASGGGEQPPRLIRRGGRSEDLVTQYDSFAPMGNGLVGVDADGVEPIAVVLDGNLAETARAPIRGGSLAVTPDGSIVGWLGTDGRPHVVEGGGARELDLPAVPQGADIAAILGDGTTCQEGEQGNGCTIFVNSDDATRAWISSSHGIVDQLGPIGAVGDASGRFVAGLVSLSDEGSCWGLFKDVRHKVWETCGRTLTDFSPSGASLLATDPYLDGFGQRSLSFVDKDGTEIASWRATGEGGATIVQTAWEDDDHALAVVFQDGAWSVVRFGADGTAEYAVPPEEGRSDLRPFTLPTR